MPAATKRFYARRSFTWGVGLVFLLGGCLLGLMILLLDGGPVDRFGLALVALLVAIGIAQCASGVRIGSTRLYVVNTVRVHRVRRDDVGEFALERWGPFPRCCVLRLRAGSRIPIWALPARNPALFREDPWAERVVTELNELRR